MFASRTAEQIGCTCYVTDLSTCTAYYGAVDPGSHIEPNYECFEHFPHTQHNAPNPILIEFWSESTGAVTALKAERYLALIDDPMSADEHGILWSRDARDRARRVISRLRLRLLAHGLLA